MTNLSESTRIYLERFLNKLEEIENEFCANIQSFIKSDKKKDLRTAKGGDIASHFDVAGATISHHLSILKQADLIREEKEKNFIYYELNTSVLEDLMVWLVDLKGDSTDENE